MTLCHSALADYPATGPPEGALQDWVNQLLNAADELQQLGNRLVRAAENDEAWYGYAADAYRKSATEVAFGCLGFADGMSTVGLALNDYLTAAHEWDDAFSAAKQLDGVGLDNDRSVELAYTQALSAADPGETSMQDLWPKMQQVVPELMGVPAPDALAFYDSPQKAAAVNDVAQAKDALSLAGLLAAARVTTVVDEATMLNGYAVTDPLTTMISLGVSTVTTGSDDPDASPAPDGGDSADEGGDVPVSEWLEKLEKPLAFNDIREGTGDVAGPLGDVLVSTRDSAVSLAQKLLGDDGTKGVAEATAAGEKSATTIAGTGAQELEVGTAQGEGLVAGDGEDGLNIAEDVEHGVSVLAIAGDVNTMINTEDAGAHGYLTRTVAGANAAATVATMAAGTLEVPGLDVAGGVVLIGTALYAVGDSVYDKVNPPHAELP